MRYLLIALAILLTFPIGVGADAPPAKQACTEQLAHQTGAPYLREVVVNARGIPIGEVAAWSCTGDVQATIAEFNARKAAMIGGAP